MIKRVTMAAWLLMGAWLVAGGNLASGRDEPKPPTEPTLAERVATIKKESEAHMLALWAEADTVPAGPKQSAIYTRAWDDEVADCRRLNDLALTKPADPAARDACLWVIDKANRNDIGTYAAEVARAGALLVRHHGDDPIAVSVGLGLNDCVNFHRDALLYGFVASAKGHETKGIARLALARYLEHKADNADLAHKFPGRQQQVFTQVGEDGQPHEIKRDVPDEDHAYKLSLLMSDASTIRAEADRLYNEVISNYGDIPYVTLHRRKLEALMREPNPKWGGEPLTEDGRRSIMNKLAQHPTLGSMATGYLDEMHNITVGKPAPEIDGMTLDGKPLKLSDYRGKVVLLVFWGSWCGPCIASIPEERQIAEKFRDRPFAVLGVDCNDKPEAAQKVVAAEKITWPNWHDGNIGDGPIVQKYHIRGYPSSFVIDANGIIRQKDFPDKSMADLISKLIDEAEGKGRKP